MMEKKAYCTPTAEPYIITPQDFLLASGDIDFDTGDLLMALFE